MKKTIEQKGITLVALIITIIVLLILAVVAIRAVQGDGIIQYARNARDEYAQAQANEQGILSSYFGEILSEQERAHNWIRNGDVLTCKCDSCLAQGTEGLSLEIGQVVNYTESGTGSSSLSGEMSGVSQGITDGKFNASDYGTDGEQTINKDTNTKWVVLGTANKDNNETNETLLLTSEKPTTQTLTLYGGNPYYYNVDEELDRMCKEIYGENARSINADDVNAVLEYTPQGGMYYPLAVGAYLQIGNFTTKISDLTDDYYNVWDSTERSSILYSSSGAKRTTFYTPEYQDGTSDESNLGKYIVNGYWYISKGDTDNVNSLPVLSDNTSTIAKNVIFGNTEYYRYYLASKGASVWRATTSWGLRSGVG